MAILNEAYGNFFSKFEWNYFATIRPHYNLTAYGSQNMIKRLLNSNGVKRVFFSLEKDFDPTGTHAHLLIESNKSLNRRKVAELLKTEAKTVSYFEKVESIEDVMYYTTKKIGKNAIHYDYFEREKL